MTQTPWKTEEEWLKCPIHSIDMIYWPHGAEYACQNIECKYGHGVTKEVIIADTMGNRS